MNAPIPHDRRTAEPPSPADVFIIDDAAAVRTALQRLLTLRGHAVATYASAELFLGQVENRARGCIILDVALPGLNGLALQDELQQRDNRMPILFLTGAADVPMCAEAMKHGALDFLTKPVDAQVLFAAVERALRLDAELVSEHALRDATASRLATLTAREREVLAHVIAGRLNKQIAADLGTAEKTIKVHRARGMEKMHVRSVAELVRVMERSHLEIPRNAG